MSLSKLRVLYSEYIVSDMHMPYPNKYYMGLCIRGGSRGGGPGIDLYSGYRKKNPGIDFYSGFRGNATSRYRLSESLGIDFYSGYRKKSRYTLL